MSNTSSEEDSPDLTLDGARSRIEGALSHMAQVVRAKSEEMKLARIAMEERKALSARVGELEEDNARLLDQASHTAASGDGVDASEVVALQTKLKTMTNDYLNLDRSFSMLKEQYGVLQEENEKLVLGGSTGPASNFAALTAATELGNEVEQLDSKVADMAALLKEAETALTNEREQRMTAERKLGEVEAKLHAVERSRADTLTQLDATIADVENLMEQEASRGNH